MSVFGNLQTAGIISDGANIQTEGQIRAKTEAFEKFVVTTKTTAGVVTYTVAELLGKLIVRDPNGASRTDVSPTSAAIVAAIKGAKVGTGFMFYIANTADAAEVITLSNGTGVSTAGDLTVGQAQTGVFLCYVTGIGATPTVTIYGLGTLAFV